MLPIGGRYPIVFDHNPKDTVDGQMGSEFLKHPNNNVQKLVGLLQNRVFRVSFLSPHSVKMNIKTYFRCQLCKHHTLMQRNNRLVLIHGETR